MVIASRLVGDLRATFSLLGAALLSSFGCGSSSTSDVDGGYEGDAPATNEANAGHETLYDAMADASNNEEVPVPSPSDAADPVLATGQQGPHAIAVDADNAYWTNSIGGTVMRLPKTGGSPVPVATGQKKPWSIAIDDTMVYWTDRDAGTVMKARIAGGPPQQVDRGGEPWGLAVNADLIFWTDHLASEVTGRPKVGLVGFSETGQGGHPAAIALDGTTVYWSNDDVGAAGFVVRVDDFLSSAPKHTVIAQGLSHPLSVALDSMSVFWASQGDGTVMSAAKTGGPAAPLASAQESPAGIAVDTTSVYWTNFDGGTVKAMPKAGGTPILIAQGQGNPDGITVDEMNVYWVNFGDGAVMRAPR